MKSDDSNHKAAPARPVDFDAVVFASRPLGDTPEDAAAIAAYLARRAKPKAIPGAKAKKVTLTKEKARAAYAASEARLKAAELLGDTPENRAPQFQVWWKKVESWYKAGEAGADSAHPWADTVCQWVALKAMRSLVKSGMLPAQCGQGFNLTCDPVSVGYLAAKAKWSSYDAAKDRGNGIEAYLYQTASGHVRNAAWELFSPSGKRERAKGAPLPKFLAGDSTDTLAAPWDEPGASEDGTIEAKELLASLAPKDQEILRAVFGLDGQPEASITELAAQRGCTEAAMYKRVERLKKRMHNHVSFV
jgi:hypothetical protein